MVPNFIDRSIWGIRSTNNFGYISGGIPDITVKTTTAIKVTVPTNGWTPSGRPGINQAIAKGTLIVGSGAKESEETLESLAGTKNSRTASVTQGATSTVTKAKGTYIPTSLGVKVKTRYY